MGHGHAAQGVPRMEPGWLLGCHPARREREGVEGRRHGAVDVLVGVLKETTTALCLTGEGVNLSNAGQPFLTTSALHRLTLQSWRTDPAASELSDPVIESTGSGWAGRSKVGRG